MYTISMDTYGLLKPICESVQYFGAEFEQPPSSGALRQLRDEKFGALFRDLSRYPKAGSGLMKRARKKRRIIYLDPLYVLFADLSEDDVVLLLDLSTVTNPTWHQPHVSRAYEIAFDVICARQPKVLAISANTADTFDANYGFPGDRMSVVPLYVPGHLTKTAATVEPLHAIKPYILFVGSLEARKNLVGAIKIFAMSKLWRHGYQMMIVGGAGHGADQIAAIARTVPNIVLMGFLSNEELSAVYKGASAFLYPSYLEGFGVPLLEAISYGIPSVASCTGACPEVGGDLVSYFDPDDHAAFAAELIRLVGLSADERAALARKGTAWIEAKFSFARYAEAFTDALDLKPSDVNLAAGASA